MVTVEVRVERMDILLLPIMVEAEAAVIMAVLEPGTFRDTKLIMGIMQYTILMN